MDPGTERRITEAIRRLSEGRTVVTIAHRLSTAEVADHVFVFDAGRLVEEGTHAELVAEGGVYGRLHDSWLGNVGERDRPARRHRGAGAGAPARGLTRAPGSLCR